MPNYDRDHTNGCGRVEWHEWQELWGIKGELQKTGIAVSQPVVPLMTLGVTPPLENLKNVTAGRVEDPTAPLRFKRSRRRTRIIIVDKSPSLSSTWARKSPNKLQIRWLQLASVKDNKYKHPRGFKLGLLSDAAYKDHPSSDGRGLTLEKPLGPKAHSQHHWDTEWQLWNTRDVTTRTLLCPFFPQYVEEERIFQFCSDADI